MTLTSEPPRGVGVVLCKTFDQYLISVKVYSKSINGLRRYASLKNFNQENPKF